MHEYYINIYMDESYINTVAQLAGAVEYTVCIFAKGCVLI